MAKNLTDLTARTATADSDLIHVNSGGTDYKETKANFSANLAKWVDFGNSSALTTQIDALAGDCAYEGLILSYWHQTETGVPINANFYVDVIKIASGAGRVKIYALNSSAKPVSYINFKSGGAWQGWVQDPTRDEITSINNSLANIGKRTEVVGDMVSTTTTFAYTGKSVTITKTSYVEAKLSYTNTSTDTIAILGNASGNSTSFYAQQKNNDVGGITPSYICCGTVLPAGTYYIWAKSRSNGSNAVYVYVTQLEP